MVILLLGRNIEKRYIGWQKLQNVWMVKASDEFLGKILSF